MIVDEALMRELDASYEGIGGPDRILLALSGGADSVALFHLLLKLTGKRCFEFICVHVHHGLRPASEDEAAFLMALCQSAGVPLIIRRVQVQRTGSLEAAARTARYHAFRAVMEESGIHVLALAHHADDQAETVLMHLMYGTGSGGLAGMRTYSRGIWRPLLGTPKEALIALLEENHLSWREDESNQDQTYLRNAIRHRVLPVLKSLAPAAGMNIVRTSRILRDEEDFWQSYIADWLENNACTQEPLLFLLTQPCLRLPCAAKRRVIREFCIGAGVELDFQQTQRLCELLDKPPGSMENLPLKAQALITRERLYLLREPVNRLPLGKLTCDQDWSKSSKLQEVLDADQLQGAELRYRRAGDWLMPLGVKGSQKLRKYMIDRQIDRPLRDSWPLLCRGSEVLWVIGVGLAQTAAVGDRTNKRVALRYEGRLPGELIQHLQGGVDNGRQAEPLP